VHAHYSHISNSGLKSDVTIVFLDPSFIKDTKISRPLRLKLWFLGAKWEKQWCDVDPQWTHF